MTNPRTAVSLRRIIILAMLLLAAAVPQACQAQSLGESRGQSADSREIIGLQYQGPIRAVFEITRDEEMEGVSKGLHYLQKLANLYQKAGVSAERLDIRAVIHGPAATALLTDAAWSRVTGKTGPNPNTSLLTELAARGVAVELCNNTRTKQGWSKGDIHPDVLLASSAYIRLIDLQLQGYAYIRF